LRPPYAQASSVRELCKVGTAFCIGAESAHATQWTIFQGFIEVIASSLTPPFSMACSS
jgi:hypothetical protein